MEVRINSLGQLSVFDTTGDILELFRLTFVDKCIALMSSKLTD